jgi:protocatechuate 3,4-dioxygenase beta subunit
MTTDDHSHDDLYHRGLSFDVGTLLRRRRVLGLFAGAGLAATVAGCATTDNAPLSTTSTAAASSTATTGATAGATATAAAGTEIPEETAGPYPGDGSNGPNILNQSGIVRSDIRTSFGTGSKTATGVPLTINLTIRNLAADGTAYAGAAVYLWHCDSSGRYSLYSQGVTSENYLRGVQEADTSGVVTFTSIFPAAYSGRWPHIHFEVYPSVARANAASNKIATSQLALPETICSTVYATAGYEQSVRNLAGSSLASDNVFRDGWGRQLATVTGSVSAGYITDLTIPVS